MIKSIQEQLSSLGCVNNEVKTLFFLQVVYFQGFGESNLYLRALHKNTIQTVDSSQVSKQGPLQKKPTLNNKRRRKLGVKKVRYLQQVCRKQYYVFLFGFLSSKTQVFVWLLFSWSVIKLVRSNTQCLILEKELKHFRRFIYVNTHYNFHQIFSIQPQVVRCPVTKHFCCALYTVKCSLLSEWVTRAETRFRLLWYHQDLEFCGNNFQPIFSDHFTLWCSKPCFCLFFF